MKKFLLAMALIFAVLAIVCFFSSPRTVDGLDFKVANLQDTIFCAASAIVSAINAVGYALYSLLEKAHNITPNITPEEEKTEEQKEAEAIAKAKERAEAIAKAKERAEAIAKAKESMANVVFCDNCGQRKPQEELNIVMMKSRKGEVAKKICKNCMELEEVKNKIVV